MLHSNKPWIASVRLMYADPELMIYSSATLIAIMLAPKVPK
jgi:hypothetical protein